MMPRRYAELDLAKIDREKRTIPISFSSEYPALQRADASVAKLCGLAPGEVYIEILDHAAPNVDLSMLNNRGAFLDEHDDKNQLGVVESATLGDDKIGRAVVKMGADDTAVKRFGQMADNIRPHVSAGYKYTKHLGSEILSNGRKAYRFAWQGMEISSVAVPNDPTVGVIYRSYSDIPVDSLKPVTVEEILATLSPEQKINMKRSLLLLDPAVTEKGAPPIDEANIRIESASQARNAFITRNKEIIKIAGELEIGFPNAVKEIRSLTAEAISSDMELGTYQMRAMQDIVKAKPAKPVLMADLGMSDDDQKQYSILRGIQNVIKRDFKSHVPEGLEGEVHEEMVKRNLGVQYGGFLVPADARVRLGGADRRSRRLTRDLQAGVFGQGGATVATQLVSTVIELLRNKMVTAALGVRQMSGLSGNVAIPRQTAAGTAYSVSEIAALTTSTQVIDQIALTPHRVGAQGIYSKQLLLQSSIDVENFLRDDLLKVIAILWDLYILNGQGSASQPLGIINTPGVAAVTFGAAATFAKMVLFETQIASANADIGAMAYVTTPAAKGVLKSAAKLLVGATTVTAVAIWEGMPGEDAPSGIVNGYRAEATNQIPNNLMVMGVWDQIIHALWGGYDVVVDPYTLASNAEVKIVMNTFGDVAVRHPQSFCVSSDAANQ